MILVIGGYAAGKTHWVQTALGYEETQISGNLADNCPVLDNLETLMPPDTQVAHDLLPALVKKEVVICREVGSGIVPIDPTDRAHREAVGRLCTALATEATCVVRIVCGLPQYLKGEPLWN